VSAPAVSHLSVSVDDNLQLWPCDAASRRQAWDIGLTSDPNLLGRVVVRGTEGTGNQLVWDISGPKNDTGTAIHTYSQSGLLSLLFLCLSLSISLSLFLSLNLSLFLFLSPISLSLISLSSLSLISLCLCLSFSLASSSLFLLHWS
jgi:hypothetical protein